MAGQSRLDAGDVLRPGDLEALAHRLRQHPAAGADELGERGRHVVLPLGRRSAEMRRERRRKPVERHRNQPRCDRSRRRLLDDLADEAVLDHDRAPARGRRDPHVENADDGGAFDRRWRAIAARDRVQPRIAAAGARHATALGKVALAREIIENALAEEWVPSLVALYSDVPLGITEERVAEARKRIDTILLERDQLASALAPLPAIRKIWRSDSNFLLLQCADAAAVLDAAVTAGLIVRDLRSNPLLTDCVRVSIGTAEQNARLLDAVRSLPTAVAGDAA